MSSANITFTETQEAGRPQLLVRTSQFLKKVSQARIARKKGDSKQQSPSYIRSARSMDIGSKAISTVEVRARHGSFDQERGSSEFYPYHAAHSNGLSQIPSLPPPSETSPSCLVDGLPATAVPVAIPLGACLNGGRAQTLPSRSISIVDAPRNESHQTATIGPSTRRALAPRLATLPPPMMAGYNAEGRARLTPSLVTRQAPMPLLNLPTLPPPAPSQPARPGRPTAPLRSIPALPMQGPIDAGQEADHESASLEDEEEEEDGDDHADGASAEGQDGESGESGDEEDHDFHETSLREPVATERPFGLGTLPEVDTSRFSVSFADATTASSSRAQRTPHVHTGPFIDYFSSKSPELAFSPMRTPRPTDFQPGGADRTQDVPQLRTVPMPSSSPRPELYHLGSRSMIDLSMSRKDKDTIISPKLGHSLSRKKPRAPIAAGPSSNLEEVEEPEPQVEIPEDVIASPMLRRRRSLPVYEPSSDPPPYPDQQFLRRGPKADILPRDDEGCERLPQYSNAIFLAAVMPRKVEFTQPGVQAKDRKWRRVYCVLEGTMLRVYKAPPAGSRVSAIEQWWENKVGVGDITSVDTAAMTTSGIRVSAVHERPREQDTERPPKIVEESGTGRASESAADAEGNSASHPSSPQLPPSRSRFHLGSRLLHSQRSKSTSRLGSNHSSSSSRVSLDSRHDNPRPSAIQHTRRSMDTLGSSRTSNTSLAGTHVTTSTTLTTPSPSSSASSPTLSSSDGVSRSSRNRFLPHTHSSGDSKEKGKEKDAAYVPDPKDLLQKYTLQNAESGLASDYVKRKNVIRVRMGGEQFLLQATDVAAVIDWIESIQMGTNVALDLDERPMPRGPIFPRRRRRRPRRVEPSASGS